LLLSQLLLSSLRPVACLRCGNVCMVPFMIISTLLPLPCTACTALGMVVASWLLPTAPMTRKVA
jgi:hypothetical protein